MKFLTEQSRYNNDFCEDRFTLDNLNKSLRRYLTYPSLY